MGFESAVPHGTAGGSRFGQPLHPAKAQMGQLRYPTLQRVAHTLPRDPKWRAHVVRTIRLLERSKNWEFDKKVEAVNRMKEVYDRLKPSAEWNEALDEKLPLNRVPSHLKRKFAKDKEYVKTFVKRYRVRKAFTRYRTGLFVHTPMKVSPLKVNYK